MSSSAFDTLLAQRIQLPGHFQGSVLIEAVRQLGDTFELQVRRSDGVLDETVLSLDEMNGLVAATTSRPAVWSWANAQHLRLLVESARIRLAYAYDRQFAVSLSGIQTLPQNPSISRSFGRNPI